MDLDFNLFLNDYDEYLNKKYAPKGQEEFGILLESYTYYREQLIENFKERVSKVEIEPGDSAYFSPELLSIHKSFNENTVSDWFGWIMQACLLKNTSQFSKVREYFINEVLNFEEGHPIAEDYEVSREDAIEEGRTDLIIKSYKNRSMLIIENKLWDKNVQKNIRYIECFEKEENWNCSFTVIIPELSLDSFSEEMDSNTGKLYGFTPLSWENVCQELRNLVKELLKGQNVIEAAHIQQYCTMINFFISSVETGVLGFKPELLVNTLKEGKVKHEDITEINRYLNYRGL